MRIVSAVGLIPHRKARHTLPYANRKEEHIMPQYQHSIVSDGAGGSLMCYPFVTQAGLDALANQFAVQDSDVFVVSYPKSGTNWVKQIVHLLSHDGVQGDRKLSEAVPLLEKEASAANLTSLSDGHERRCFISHLPYQLMPGVQNSRARYIVVARNPKDCAVSYVHFLASRSDMQYQGSWDEFFALFLEGQVPYGGWFDHVLAWWQASQQASNILFVTYEALHQDLATTVARIAHFIGIPLTPALCAAVVAQSSFTAMFANAQVNVPSPHARYSNRNLRKGHVGDWHNHFSPEQNACFDALYQQKMAGTGLILTFDLEPVHAITANPRYGRAVPLQPAVSCICLTYARPEVLEEAIYSFLQQEYRGPKELVVLNDCAEQTLVFDHPEVRVINVPKRLCTVGEKMNMAVALAAHDLLFVWDDDAIYLPHHLSFSVAQFDPTKGFFKPNQAWVWDNGQVYGPETNLVRTSSCWSRDRFDAVRGYDAEGTGHDLFFEHPFAHSFPGATTPVAIQPADISYIYRWSGTGSYHSSDFGDLKPGENGDDVEVAAYIRQQARRGEIRQGHILLQPHWKTDYRQSVSNSIATLAEQQVQHA